MTVVACDFRCTSDAGYQAHRRAGEEPCPSSKAAHNVKQAADMRKRRRDGKTHEAAQRKLGRAAIRYLRERDPDALDALAVHIGHKL